MGKEAKRCGCHAVVIVGFLSSCHHFIPSSLPGIKAFFAALSQATHLSSPWKMVSQTMSVAIRVSSAWALHTLHIKTGSASNATHARFLWEDFPRTSMKVSVLVVLKWDISFPLAQIDHVDGISSKQRRTPKQHQTCLS